MSRSSIPVVVGVRRLIGSQNLRQGRGQLELSERPAAGLETADVLERIRTYAAASRAGNTWRAYQSDFRHFAAWCAAHGIAEPVPAAPATVAAYLTDFVGQLAASTLTRRLYALSAIHRMGGHPVPAEAPEVQAVWSGIKRTHRTAARQKAATRSPASSSRSAIAPRTSATGRSSLSGSPERSGAASSSRSTSPTSPRPTTDSTSRSPRRSPTRKAPVTSSVSPTARTRQRAPSAPGAHGSR